MKESPQKISLGTFPFSNPFTPVDRRTAYRIVKAHLNLGGRHIATSPIYGFGQVETLLGQILSAFPRRSYSLSTSCGYILDTRGLLKVSGRYKDVIKSCEDSLRRLDLETIDTYYSHTPDPTTPFEETIGAMEQLRKEGKIKSIGISNVTLGQLRGYNCQNSIQYVQNRFSLLNRSLSAEFCTYCEEHKIKIAAYQVIERGLLTDNPFSGLVLRDGDLRRSKPEFAPQIVRTIGQWVVKHLKPLAEELRVSVSALVAWWVLQQKSVALCQCGSTKEKQVIENLQAASIRRPFRHVLDCINTSYEILAKRIERDHQQSILEFMGLAKNSGHSEKD